MYEKGGGGETPALMGKQRTTSRPAVSPKSPQEIYHDACRDVLLDLGTDYLIQW